MGSDGLVFNTVHDVRPLSLTWSPLQEALSDFAIKGSRPLLPRVGSMGKLRDLQRSDDVLFLSVGTTEDTRKCLGLVAPQTVHETIIAEVNFSLNV